MSMTKPESMDCYVLAGQSNMEGIGWMETPSAQPPNVWAFSMAGDWEPARHPLHFLLESYTPVHVDLMSAGNPLLQTPEGVAEEAERQRLHRRNWVGPGLSFGTAMTEATGRPVGLLPCAHGGTSLDQWSPDLKDRGVRSLYGAMLDRIYRVMEDSPASALKGILWYQGESDGGTPETASSYGDRFHSWVEAVRRDVAIPDLPVVAVQLGCHIQPGLPDIQHQCWDQVRAAQAKLPSRVPYTAVTSAVDLPLDDGIHISAEGQERLGRRLARRMRALQFGSGSLTGPRLESVERLESRENGIGVARIRIADVQGRLCGQGRLSGFSVEETQPDDSTDPLTLVDVRIDSTHAGPSPQSAALQVLLNRTPNGSDVYSYGQGRNPYCSLVDEMDDPLLSFTRCSPTT